MDQLKAQFGNFSAPHTPEEVGADWGQLEARLVAGKQGPAHSGAQQAPTGGSAGMWGLGMFAGLMAVVTAYWAYSSWQDTGIASEEHTVQTQGDDNQGSEMANSQSPKESIVHEDGNAPNSGEYHYDKEKTVPVAGPGMGHGQIGNRSASNNSIPDKGRHRVDTAKNEQPAKRNKRAVASLSSVLVCANESIEITLANPASDNLYIYRLVQAQDKIVVQQGGINGKRRVKVILPGSYQLEVVELRDKGSRVLLQRQIEVAERPIAKIGIEEGACGLYHIKALADKRLDFIWAIDGKAYSGQNIDLGFAIPGTKQLQLIARKGECSDTARTEIHAVASTEHKKPKMPNIFTPNGDGMNDVFDLSAKNSLGSDGVALNIEVYNQSGQLVYKSGLGKEGAWDGTWMNQGANCEPGNYTYVLQYPNPCDNTITETIKGLVSLNR